ncbi:PIG-L family deacetylase [Cellulomonas sp. PhB143]|uniref:PIG-L family deacetylase n=1 Tax=Cellulomonas sp. PhB143 TaxID=2485186 RepID=UPI000F48F86F|nr:PIG-L family deacetylase [Cellulomonas sp. PhB143]ROS78647.1 LmbE family N-acetylglucosaminyl deacetylase [Cellulomonas sp. PhB143]
MSFDHRDPGTPEEAWRAAGVAERPPALDLAVLDAGAVERVVVLAAHPDDESLGAGGLLARAARRGAEVCVVVATDGEAASPEPSADREALAARRRREVVAAVAHVAPRAAVHLLGLPDGGLREHRARLAAALGAVLDAGSSEGAPTTTVLAAPWRGDGHRDHRVAGEVAAALAAEPRAGQDVTLLEYPVWLWHWADPADDAVPWEHLRSLGLSEDERDAKRRAVAAHASQAEGDEPVLHAGMLRHFDRDVELFVTSPPADPAPAGPGTPGGRSLPVGFFDDFYTGRSDPWGFETRWYEERKRALTLAALPRQRFATALEVGCSTGVLTAELATRCDRVLGVDIAAAPLEAARRRLGDRVELFQVATPGEWPAGRFDLVVLSEVGYYWGPADLSLAIDRATASLADDGVLIACHWRHEVPEYPGRGDDVHRALRARGDLATLVRHEEEDFLLDVLVRPPAVSVARRAGLA